MPISFTFGPVKLANLTTVRTEINRIRVKHGLSTVTFTADDGFVRATTMADLKTKITGIDQSSFITTGSINVSSIPDFSTSLKVLENDFNSMSSVLATVDAICVHYSNYSNYSDNPNYSNYSDNPNYSQNSVQSVQSNNTNENYCYRHC